MDGATFGRVVGGSPAGAGIDPRNEDIVFQKDWFPRRRGDRPPGDMVAFKVVLVPPQARG